MFLFFMSGCENSDEYVSTGIDSIEIGYYKFEFNSEFTLIEEQGIDSYVGRVEAPGIQIHFDFGWYTSSLENLPTEQYMVNVDTIDGHYSQIIKAINSEVDITRIHLYKIQDSIDSPNGFNSLTMTSTNLTIESQDLVLSIYNSWSPIE